MTIFIRTARRFVVTLVAIASIGGTIATLGGCQHQGKRRSGSLGGDVVRDDGRPVALPKITSRDLQIEFDVDGAAVALGARVTGPDGQKGPIVVIVPGGGDASKEGLRKGDGVIAYDKPIDTGTAWSESLARRGALVLTYDKRTCGPNDVATCQKNPQKDLDEQGPVALARDVDAACALARQQPGFDGRLILWAHGQAAQVALSSSCANDAAAIVLLSPVPRGIDDVLVAAIADRQKQAAQQAKTASAADKNALVEQSIALKNLVGTKSAEFSSMKGGKFAKDARVGGATVAFWLGWIALTEKTAALLQTHKDKVVVVVGRGDTQLSAKDREAAQQLPAKRVVAVDADHHLLKNGALDEAVVKQIADAIDDVTGVPRS